MSPQVIRSIKEMQEWSTARKRSGRTVGLVPTMGCLHDGHLSLVRKSKAIADLTVVSIFVNPTQFSADEDLDAYPKTWDTDLAACEAEGVDAIFFPTDQEMYPSDYSTWIVEEKLSKPLCGKRRPTHFRGVTTVVTKLFNAVLPDVAVFGQKDAQQALIIQRMVRDLNIPVNVIVEPIVREADGLAMSSRNKYLSTVEREQAPAIKRGLDLVQASFAAGERDSTKLVQLFEAEIASTVGRIDYAEVRDCDTLELIDTIDSPALLAVAVHFGDARLLDNVILD